MNSIKTTVYKSPVGELLIGVFNDQLCMVDWLYRKQRNTINSRIELALNASLKEEPVPLHEATIHQLKEYFKGSRTKFDLPILFAGTDFQKRVWSQLQEIKYGDVVSYATLSRKLNNDKAIRAVAAANGANSLSIIIPCHRVIGSDGSLTGYAGGLTAKKKLLQIEGALFKNQLKLF